MELSPAPRILEAPQGDNLSDTNRSNVTEALLELLTFTYESRIEAIVYGFLFIFASMGNVPVLISLLKIRRRKSRVQKMILHLTIADILVTFVMIPLEIAWRITIQWIAGDAICRLMLFMRAFGPYLSSMVLICISLDRYTAIVHPLRVTDAQRRTNVMLFLAWSSSILCSIPQSIIFHVESHPVQSSFHQCVSFNSFSSEFQRVGYNLFCIMVLYGAPLIVIIFCYSRIMWEIRQRSKRTNNDPCELYVPSSRMRVNIRMSDVSQIERSRARTLKMTIIIVLTFFCCWTPYVVIDLWYLFDSTSAEALDSRLQSSLFMFAVSNSCVNPLVYGSYIFSYSTFIRNFCSWPFSRRRVEGQASFVHSRATQIDRLQPNVFAPMMLEGDQYRLYPATEGIHLELRQASPVRRPINRRRPADVQDDEESEFQCSSKSSCHRCNHGEVFAFD